MIHNSQAVALLPALWTGAASSPARSATHVIFRAPGLPPENLFLLNASNRETTPRAVETPGNRRLVSENPV